MADISQMAFELGFLEWKFINFNLDIIEVCS